MRTKVIDGKALADKILQSVREDVLRLTSRPRLSVVAFGDDSSHYIQQKRRVADFLGIEFSSYVFSSSPSSHEARRELNKVAKQNREAAVIVQLPLPKSVSTAVLNVIPPERDPDVLSDRSVGLFFNGRLPIAPPTAQAVLAILREGEARVQGKTVTLFGHGHLVGKFLIPLLLTEGAIIKAVARPLSPSEIIEFAAGSDVVISATGDPLFLDAELLPRNATVIDAGFSLLDDRIVGDIDFSKTTDRFSAISPVPGGVGPVGVAYLFKNVATLYSVRHHA